MGHQSKVYERYMHSQAWADKRAEYRKSGRPVTCRICGSAKIQFHHRTYKRFRKEHLDDLVPLCQAHHSALHQFQRDNKLTVWDATNQYLSESNAVKRARPAKQPKAKLTPQQKAAKKTKAAGERARQVENARRARLGLPPLVPKHIEPLRTEGGAIRSSGQRRPKKMSPKPRSQTKKTQPYPF